MQSQQQPPYVSGAPQLTGRYPVIPPRKPRRRGTLALILGIGVALAGLCLGGVAIIGMSAGDDTSTPAGGAAPSATAAAQLAPKPAATIDDGVWTVGEDIAPGTYKVTKPLSGELACYWKITKTGSNGSDIIDNALPRGGLPRVTLRAGQDFETKRCGTWRKL